jgi:hypothetical protein
MDPSGEQVLLTVAFMLQKPNFSFYGDGSQLFNVFLRFSTKCWNCSKHWTGFCPRRACRVAPGTHEKRKTNFSPPDAFNPSPNALNMHI